MDFRISALPAERFAPLFGLSDQELQARHAQRLRCDRSPGFPCRVSLRDAAVGEQVLLLNFEHLAVATPYASRYAVFVREGAVQARPEVNEVPQVLSSRLIAVRAFAEPGTLIAAEVVPGSQLAETLPRLLQDRNVSYLHLHNAAPGCYAARAERA
jgi:Protein of unknown function (DUF1203)